MGKILGFVVGMLLLVAALFVLGASALYFGWNFGVAPAFGVAPISFFTACALSLFIGVVGSAFRSRVSTK